MLMKINTVLTILSAICLVGCRTKTVDPAVRAQVMAKGHPLYLPTLEHQVRQHLGAYHGKTIAVKVPKSEKTDDYPQALSILFPGTTFHKAGAAGTIPTVEIVGTRRTGALIGETFGAVTVGESRKVFLYYLKIGRPIPGKPHHWWVAKEEPWPADVAPPLRPK